MTIPEIAARNHADRMAQLSRLRPAFQGARAKREALRKAQQGAGNVRESIELMSSLKHVPNFFPTPAKLVQRVIEEASLEPGMVILEPSAGKGDIADAAHAAGAEVHCIEKMFTLAEHLRKKPYADRVMCADFLAVHPDPRNMQKFDRILMNPPFERGIDEDHIRHAFKFLRVGGRLVAIACSTTGDKLQGWVDDHGGIVEPLPAGSFATSERPTQVNTCLITVDN